MNGFIVLFSTILLCCYTTAENVTSSAHTKSQQAMVSTQQLMSFSTDMPSSTQSLHHSSTSSMPSSSLSSEESSHFQSQHASTSLHLSTSSTDLPAQTSVTAGTSSPQSQVPSSQLVTRSMSVSKSSQLISLSSSVMTSSMPVMESSSDVLMSSTQVKTISISSSTEPSMMLSSPVYFTSHSVLVSSSLAANMTATPALPTTESMAPTSTVEQSLPVTQMAMNSTASMPMSTAMMSSSVAPTTPKPTTHKPTTPKPTPSGDVKFSFKNSNNVSCVTIAGKVTFDVTYMTTEKTNVTASIELSNNDTIITGKCPSAKLDNSTSMISVKWGNFYEMSLNFTFGADASWYLSQADFHAVTTKNHDFVNATKAKYSASKSLNKSADGNYGASSNHSYMCDPSEKLALSGNVVVHFENIHMQPFDLMKGGEFSNADVCGAGNKDSKPNSLVPIIVGCALAGLIVIVLIAYLIGRRKSSRGYQQV